LSEAKAQRRGRILLAEDNPTNQKVALGLLKKLGYRADVVSNGREAVEALVRQPYDLVLMDCQMPELDGFAATAEIRQREGDQHHTLIMAMTANAMPGDRERCLAAGMDDYVSKPITLAILRDKLAVWLPEEPEAAPEEQGPTSPEDCLVLPAPLDAQRIDTIREVLEEVFPEAVVEYIQSTSQHLQELHQAITQHDLLSISYVAHTLKGSCSNLGATHLAELCRELMDASKASVLVDMTQHMARIEAEFTRVRTALEHICRVAAVEAASGAVHR
jgi:CheY-like chemotaxis protein/HPt (histidine-containing phosphotransfer) domain-containing protein